MENEVPIKEPVDFENLSYGTHFCQFYRSREDLVEVLVPYLKRGLENNEACIWVASPPLDAEHATAALEKGTRGLSDYIASGQMEIIDGGKWYRTSGSFEPERVLRSWNNKVHQAESCGYRGLRVTGNSFFVPGMDWGALLDYEAAINETIDRQRMIALCSYPADQPDPVNILDVISRHQFGIMKRNGHWTRVSGSLGNGSNEQTVKNIEAYAEGLQRMSARLIRRRDEEKKDLSLKLQEDLAQSLGAIKLFCEGIHRHIEKKNRDEALELLGRVISYTKGFVQEVRELSKRLYPSLLGDLGILPTISWFCRNFEQSHHIPVCRETLVKEDDVPDNLKTVIYRILEEALTNVARHSRATHGSVTLEKIQDSLQLTINDNGVGMDDQEIATGGFRSKGSGILEMRERARLSHGNFRIESEKEKGTKVRVSWLCNGSGQ